MIDNARFHKSKKVVDLINSVGCRIIFLPPYSPDLNPIEKRWAKLKSAIRRNVRFSKKSFYDVAVNTIGNMCLA